MFGFGAYLTTYLRTELALRVSCFYNFPSVCVYLFSTHTTCDAFFVVLFLGLEYALFSSFVICHFSAYGAEQSGVKRGSARMVNEYFRVFISFDRR